MENGAKFQVEGGGRYGWRAESQAMLSDAMFALESFYKKNVPKRFVILYYGNRYGSQHQAPPPLPLLASS